MLELVAYRCASLLERLLVSGVGHSRGSLRQAVNAGNPHKHLVLHLAHKLYRAEGPSHDSHPQTPHVEHLEHRVSEHRDIHRRHSIDRRAFLAVNGSQHHQRVEPLHHYLGAAVGDDIHRGQHNSKAVEKRNAAAKLV